MNGNEQTQHDLDHDHEMSDWFAQAGPTESFLRNAPQTISQENHETQTTIKTDPAWFATVGPTPGFVYCR